MSASAGRVLLIPKGEWNSTTEYSNLDIVHHNTSTWVCKKTCIGVEPSDAQTSYWQAMAKDATEQIATTSTNGLMSASDKTKLNSIAAKAEVNVQSDWSVTDTSSDAYIKNKPTIDSAISTTSTNAVQNKAVTAELNKKVNAVSGKGLSTNDYTTAEKTKLSKIANGAEVNVQSDWSVTDTSSDAYIKNKPSLSAVATSGSYNDLSNKPTIPSAVIVDSAISSTSTNPVQNKVVKAYLDDGYSELKSEVTTNLLSINCPSIHNVNGVSFINNGDGTYTMNGTNTTDDELVIFQFSPTGENGFKLPLGTYKIIGVTRDGSVTNSYVCFQIGGTNDKTEYRERTDDSKNGAIFTVTDETERYRIVCYCGVKAVINNAIIKPMITTNLDATYDDFVPYTGNTGALNNDVSELRKLYGWDFACLQTWLNNHDIKKYFYLSTGAGDIVRLLDRGFTTTADSGRALFTKVEYAGNWTGYLVFTNDGDYMSSITDITTYGALSTFTVDSRVRTKYAFVMASRYKNVPSVIITDSSGNVFNLTTSTSMGFDDTNHVIPPNLIGLITELVFNRNMSLDELQALGAGGVKDTVSDTWVAYMTYGVGSYAIYKDKLYKCLVENTAQKPDTSSTYWEACTVVDELKTFKTKLDSVPKLDYTSVFSDNSKHEIDFTGTAGTSMYMQSLYTPTDVNTYTHAKIGLVNTSGYPSVHSKCIQEYYNQGYILRTEIKQTMTNVNIIAYKYADLGVNPTSASYQFNSSNFFSDLANGLGTSSYPWSNIYSKTAVTVTSDRNKKKDIRDISTDRAIELIKHLKPSTYKLIDGTSDRTHYGMIAQDVEEMLTELGMDSKDFAGFIKSPKEEIDKETGKSTVVEGEYDYMLRYEEFIAPLISTVQNLMDRVEVLEAKLKELEG